MWELLHRPQRPNNARTTSPSCTRIPPIPTHSFPPALPAFDPSNPSNKKSSSIPAVLALATVHHDVPLHLLLYHHYYLDLLHDCGWRRDWTGDDGGGSYSVHELESHRSLGQRAGWRRVGHVWYMRWSRGARVKAEEGEGDEAKGSSSSTPKSTERGGCLTDNCRSRASQEWQDRS
jgi:hypothetical protein